MPPVAVLTKESWEPRQVVGWSGDAKTEDEILEGMFGDCAGAESARYPRFDRDIDAHMALTDTNLSGVNPEQNDLRDIPLQGAIKERGNSGSLNERAGRDNSV